MSDGTYNQSWLNKFQLDIYEDNNMIKLFIRLTYCFNLQNFLKIIIRTEIILRGS